MTDQFKNCFIDESEIYAYDIEFDGKLIAKAHSLSAKDRSQIERKAMIKGYKNGEMTIDIDSHAHKTQTILAAVNSWQLDRPLNEDSVSLLNETLRDHLYNAIQKHEEKIAGVVEDTEKN
jgi:hypothetical protein